MSDFSAVPPLVFELLAAHHDRQGFDCGEESLNDFLRRQARQNAERSVGITHVAVPRAGEAQILGYYTLLVRTVDKDLFASGKKLPGSKRLPPGPIGVVLLGRLAVSRDAQGQGLGTLMLLRAIRQTERAAREMGIYALVVDALNDAARKWYLGLDFGFETLLDDPFHLFLPVGTMRQLGLSET